jgi:5-methylthioadenosine/S-adenosylhomocysteine deaminase
VTSLLIENVVVDGRKTRIRCRDGMIEAIGDDLRRSGDSEDVLEGRGYLAMAPLINSHTHSAMTLFRGYGDDLPLREWLQTRIWPHEQHLNEDEVYAGARLAIVEMLRNGTVFCNDMYWNARGLARAVEEMGVRACIGDALIDMGDPAAGAPQRARIEGLLEEIDGLSPRVTSSISPHAIYTVSEEALRWAAATAADRGLVLHIHLAETEQEVKDCQTAHGCSPVEYLHGLGLLSERTVAAHTVWLSDRDVELLGERRVVCVHNPVSNMKLAVGGVYPYRKLAEAGAVCAIGTDGAASNNSLDVFDDMKTAALLQKFHEGDPTAMPAREAWAMAVENPAEAFGLPGPELTPGRPADLILVDGHRPELQPPHSLSSHLVYSATGGVVDSVVCDGRVVMRHRKVPGEEEIAAAAREAARALFADAS